MRISTRATKHFLAPTGAHSTCVEITQSNRRVKRGDRRSSLEAFDGRCARGRGPAPVPLGRRRAARLHGFHSLDGTVPPPGSVDVVADLRAGRAASSCAHALGRSGRRGAHWPPPLGRRPAASRQLKAHTNPTGPSPTGSRSVPSRTSFPHVYKDCCLLDASRRWRGGDEDVVWTRPGDGVEGVVGTRLAGAGL